MELAKDANISVLDRITRAGLHEERPISVYLNNERPFKYIAILTPRYRA